MTGSSEDLFIWNMNENMKYEFIWNEDDAGISGVLCGVITLKTLLFFLRFILLYEAILYIRTDLYI